MNQTEQILAHLKRAPLTPLIALQKYGVFRLAARINDLRMAGHSISTYRKRLSSGKTVAVYRMFDEDAHYQRAIESLGYKSKQMEGV